MVFARHVEVQEAVLERFPDAAHLLGRDSGARRDETVTAFQSADGPQLLIAATRVAAQGITLTRASNVAFLELEWTPAMHDQAEDRCHRIGQRDAVTAWYLLAADTIDETMATLIQRKRGIVAAVTDGARGDTDGLVEGVVRELREGRPLRHLRPVAYAARSSGRHAHICEPRPLRRHFREVRIHDPFVDELVRPLGRDVAARARDLKHPPSGAWPVNGEFRTRSPVVEISTSLPSTTSSTACRGPRWPSHPAPRSAPSLRRVEAPLERRSPICRDASAHDQPAGRVGGCSDPSRSLSARRSESAGAMTGSWGCGAARCDRP